MAVRERYAGDKSHGSLTDYTGVTSQQEKSAVADESAGRTALHALCCTQVDDQYDKLSKVVGRTLRILSTYSVGEVEGNP